MEQMLEALRCVPSRRSVKFTAGPHARHFIAFDAAVSKEERILLYMELFAFAKSLVDRDILPDFPFAAYLPEELVGIRVVSDPRHPAYGQAGLYANRPIPSGTIVAPYAGIIEIFTTSCNSRTYTMGFGSLSDDYALDAEFCGNCGRFANDPRGVEGQTANLSAESKYSNRGESFTALVARRLIQEGEEILMSYGKAHSLSASPWVGVRGDALMRPRFGGTVPFPMLKHCAQPVTANGTAVTVDDEEEASFQVMWECTQCAAWSPCHSPAMVRIDYCVVCHSPKLSGAKLVALLSSQPVTVDTLKAAAGVASPCPVEDTPIPSPAEVGKVDGRVRQRVTGRPSNGPTSASPSCIIPPSPGPSTTSHQWPPLYSSMRVDWPMNVPFLPWQVWDTAVPATALGKHSKFDSSEHIFLYHVGCEGSDGSSSEEGDRSGEFMPSGEHNSRRRANNRPERSTRPGRWEKRVRQETSTDGGALVSAQSPTVSPSSSSVLHVPTGTSPPCPSLQRVLSLRCSVERFLLLLPHLSEATLLESVRQSLRSMSCRPFTGRSFEAGEVISYVGGCVRRSGDSRVRPDGSPLAIPMKYLIPASTRRRICEGQWNGSGCEGQSTAATNTQESARHFLHRLSGLTFVVTNEMMFCPCLALLTTEEEKNLGTASDAAMTTTSRTLQMLMDACNATLTLSMDSLGCPYVALVATRHIDAFAALLARTQ